MSEILATRSCKEVDFFRIFVRILWWSISKVCSRAYTRH